MMTGLGVDATHCADHFRSKEDVIDRDDPCQQFLAGQMIDAGVEKDVPQDEVGQQPELGVLCQTAEAAPMVRHRTAAVRNDEFYGREILEYRRSHQLVKASGV